MRLAAVLTIALLAGCGDAPRAEPPPRSATPAATATATASPRPALRRARCPAGVPGCASVQGRVAYVERVDPDGDGDLHVVVLAGRVTAPGATAIDVSKDLRPRRDPRVGDLVAAAGPVQTGSYGQKQIHAVVFRTAR